MNKYTSTTRLLSFLVVLVLMLVAAQATAQESAVPEPSTAVSFERAEPDGTLRRIRVPILMYHYVSPMPPDADDIRRNLTVTPELFRQHLDYLRAEGYSTISLYDLDNALLTGEPLPEKPVVLTFDDGYIDAYTVVFPMLQEYGFTGTFFIITGRADANDPVHLSWEQIREMSDAGMSMESHTKNHPDLRGRDMDFLTYEVMGSLESLEHYTGVPPRMFCYPIGHYDATTLALMETAPVWRAVTTQPGMFHTTSNELELPRVRVNGGTGAGGLDYLLQGDWLD